MTVPELEFHDGKKIPQLGFGVWQVENEQATPAVAKALEVGYRHIDTAAIYGNEEGVGKAIKDSGIAREELFITTKLWNDAHKADDARKAIETSLEKLGLDHVDLYLIHWPATVKYGDAFIEAWDAMQQFKAEGLVTSIGVSNHNLEHLDKLNGETPVINQVELHPTWQQADLRAVHAERGILTEAWSPLGQAKDLQHEVIAKIAEKHLATPAQVIIRWHLQLGNVVIPKSVTPERIESNFDVFRFELTDADMEAIATIPSDNRLGANPAEADF